MQTTIEKFQPIGIKRVLKRLAASKENAGRKKFSVWFNPDLFAQFKKACGKQSHNKVLESFMARAVQEAKS